MPSAYFSLPAALRDMLSAFRVQKAVTRDRQTASEAVAEPEARNSEKYLSYRISFDDDAGDEASFGLAKTLEALGLRLNRMKTGQERVSPISKETHQMAERSIV